MVGDEAAPAGDPDLSTTVRRRKPGFSLATLLQITTIVVLALAVVILYRKIAPLREEISRLKIEVGELDIQDRAEFHAVRVRTDSQHEWKWRIWVPKGKRCRVCAAFRRIPRTGFPPSGASVNLNESGEFVVRFTAHRDRDDGHFYASLSSDDATFGHYPLPWLDVGGYGADTAGVERETVMLPSEYPSDLLRFNVNKPWPHSWEDSSRTERKSYLHWKERPTDGVLIWLEPLP